MPSVIDTDLTPSLFCHKINIHVHIDSDMTYCLLCFVISGSLILSLNVNWFLYQSLLDLLLPSDNSDVLMATGSMLPQLAAVFKASKLLPSNKTINKNN